MIKLIILLLTITTALVTTQKTIKSGDVVFVTELTRHGARAPLSDITEYIKRDWIQNYGKGELTGVGMRQHYYLGKNTATKYPELLADLTNYEEYYIRSTNVNRTMMSAQSHIVGLRGNSAFTGDDLIWNNDDPKMLPPVDQLNFPIADIDFKTALPNGMLPFPVHVPNELLDLKLGADGASCPTNAKQMHTDRLSSEAKF